MPLKRRSIFLGPENWWTLALLVNDISHHQLCDVKWTVVVGMFLSTDMYTISIIEELGGAFKLTG